MILDSLKIELGFYQEYYSYSTLCKEEGRMGVEVDWLHHCHLWREDHSLCCC